MHGCGGWSGVGVGLLAGFALDSVLGDPRRHHPVAWFGTLAARLEQSTYAPSRGRGASHVAFLVGGTVALGVLAERSAGPLRTPLIAAATWTVLGGRSLSREGGAMDRLLRGGRIDDARYRVRGLVGRDPSGLDADELARATVESLAENTSDAVVAPLVWGAIAGVPGLLGYRAVNTLDAMIGHRSERYLEFGWAAARLDDLANWAPARLTVVATALAAALSGPAGSTPGDSPRSDAPTLPGRADRAAQVLRIAARDGRRHPSPNAGPVEAGFAAALGRRLGGTNSYGGEVETRGTLGDGPPVTVADIGRAVALQERVGLAALVLVVSGRWAVRRAMRGRRRAR